MFFLPENKTAHAIAAGIDLAVDFATLGEYRLVTDRAAPRPKPRSLWADDVEWSASPRTREATCSLPRARDRVFARARVVG